MNVQRLTKEARYAAARRRVGFSAVSQSKWLLRFPERSVASLADAEAVRWETIAFVSTGAGPTPTPPLGAQIAMLGPRRPMLTDRDPRRALKSYQRRACEFLKALRQSGCASVVMQIEQVVWNADGRAEMRAGGGELNRFDAAMALTIVAAGTRLRRCPGPECEQAFVKEGKQAYCSPKCSQRTRTARFEATHRPERREAAHARYEQKVRQQHPRARIVRRPRRP